MKLITRITVLFFVVATFVSAETPISQFIDPLDGRFDASTYLAENAYGFLPVPIIITDPALEGGLGGLGLFFHETEEEAAVRKKTMLTSENAASHLLPPSVSVAALAKTGNDSWFAGGGHMGFFNRGKIRYLAGAGHGDINLNFFGFGNITMNKPIELNTRANGLFQRLVFQLPKTRLYLGLVQRYIDAEIQPTHIGDIGSGFIPPEWQEKFEEIIRTLLTARVRTSGLGLAFEYDSRDNVFSPTLGYQYKIDYVMYNETIGSDIEYELTSFSGLNYWRLSQDIRAGLRVASEVANTNSLLPPFALPGLKLRGVPTGRYQGAYVVASELELIYELDTRWSVLGFLGAGRTGNSMQALKENGSLVSHGLGFRYLLARRYGFSAGIDVAYGPEDTVWYIQAGSAW